jgi:hypothetical protein
MSMAYNKGAEGTKENSRKLISTARFGQRIKFGAPKMESRSANDSCLTALLHLESVGL